MIKENVGMMPVIQDSKVAGMMRLSDLFKEISEHGIGRISPVPGLLIIKRSELSWPKTLKKCP